MARSDIVKTKLKGGIETIIIATVILVGIVIALIIAVVLPAANETKELGETGTGKIDDLRGAISGEE